MATNPDISNPYKCAVHYVDPPWHPKSNDGTCDNQADILFSVGLDTVTEACKGKQWTPKMFDQKNCEKAMNDVIQTCKFILSCCFPYFKKTLSVSTGLCADMSCCLGPEDPQYKGATKGGRESLDCVLYIMEVAPKLSSGGTSCPYVEAEQCKCGWIPKGAKCKSVGCDCYS